MLKIDIIILSNAQTPELRSLTIQTIETLLASEDPSEIRFMIQVFESAEIGTYNYPFCQTLFPPKPFNFNRYMNMGIKRSTSAFVCMCNNDLIFHPGWASRILEAFNQNSELVSASPICEINHRERGILPNTGIHIGYEIRKHVSGWCLFFKRSMVKQTGLMDERFRFWFVDNDYAKTLEKSRILHALITDSRVDHLESQTLKTRSKKEQLSLTTDDRYLFECKWGSRSYFSYLNYKRKRFFRNI